MNSLMTGLLISVLYVGIGLFVVGAVTDEILRHRRTEKG